MAVIEAANDKPLSRDPPKLPFAVGMTGNKHFNELAYITQGKLKEGEDAYKRYAFNQEASERFRSDRNIMDTRHYM